MGTRSDSTAILVRICARVQGSNVVVWDALEVDDSGAIEPFFFFLEASVVDLPLPLRLALPLPLPLPFSALRFLFSIVVAIV